MTDMIAAMAPSWRPLARRSDERELLDGDDLDPADLRANLRELALLNRLPGGTSASVAGIRHLLGDAATATVLDVGTGGADMPLGFVRAARHDRSTWRVTALDHRPEVLQIARRRTRKQPAVTVLEGDALALPLPDASFDVAHASLLLHHFDPSDAVAALRELRRVSREGVVVNDLRRGMAPYALTWITTMTLSRNRYTRHDGPASARRAYSLTELDNLLTDAGLRPVWRSATWLPRVATAAVAREQL